MNTCSLIPVFFFFFFFCIKQINLSIIQLSYCSKQSSSISHTNINLKSVKTFKMMLFLAFTLHYGHFEMMSLHQGEMQSHWGLVRKSSGFSSGNYKMGSCSNRLFLIRHLSRVPFRHAFRTIPFLKSCNWGGGGWGQG